ncbi:unnamed protein product [Bursaphelenchus okinawaensis]|uniref:Kinase n=1 Tax=Bursaphelenchus okinawaensis TaxID=465554 RepID=A0A811KU17_9BILA|nr:unnamed protein product [Bursaphelenchus okinawaensis]CAG9112434.1 unnamed protein product [Bursaphelenchus okinawaensis]
MDLIHCKDISDNPYRTKHNLTEQELKIRKKCIAEYTLIEQNEVLPPPYTWYSDQIAGHNINVIKDGKCQIGIIKKDDSKILKLRMPFERGDCEVWFYSMIQKASTSLNQIDKLEAAFKDLVEWVPKYYGLETLLLSGIDRQFLVMEDLLASYQQPCLIDVKMGKVSFDPHATEQKKTQELSKSAYQQASGFRVLGYRVHKNGQVESRDRVWGKTLNQDSITEGFKSFLSSDRSDKSATKGLLSKIRLLEKHFQTHSQLQFYASSILLIYEGDQALPTNEQLKMIDFSHVFQIPNTADLNYIPGLQTLTDIFVNITR